MAGDPWAVVLAGGDGRRVAGVTRDAEGHPVPKQYWPVAGGAPMLRWALARARRVAPPSRVLVVVNQGHRRYWELALADVFRHNVLVQPCNRGTAAGVLFALLAIGARDGPEAAVVFLPSDHYVANEAVLRQAVLTALAAGDADGQAVYLLGITPDAPEPDYGWLLPASTDVVADVVRFIEKPPIEAILPLMARGALINSFVLVTRVDALLRVFARAAPDLLAALRGCLGCRAVSLGLARAYEAIASTDLSRDVLAAQPRGLRVVRVAPCGWSDLGTPDRLQPFLVDHGTAA